jgi:hypothetical protein
MTEEITRETVRDLIEQNNRLYDQRFNASQDALQVALTSNNQRLDAMNEFRATLSDQSSRMISRLEADAAIKSSADRIYADLSTISAKVEVFSRPNYTLIGSFASIVFVMVAGVWLVIGLKIDVSEAPVAFTVEQLKVSEASRERQVSDMSTIVIRNSQETLALTQSMALITAAQTLDSQRLNKIEIDTGASQQADASSRSDRGQLNDRTKTLEQITSTSTAERRSQEAETKQKLVEIETQFKSMSNTLNIITDHIQQWLTVLYEKVFPDQKFPRTDFRPNLYSDHP